MLLCLLQMHWLYLLGILVWEACYVEIVKVLGEFRYSSSMKIVLCMSLHVFRRTNIKLSWNWKNTVTIIFWDVVDCQRYRLLCTYY